MTGSSRLRLFLLACAFAAGAALPGCQSSRLEDLAPLAGVRNTGTTPDLNVPQQAETAQFSEADKNAKTAELKAALTNQGIQAQGPAPRTSPADLRKAAQQQTQTLKEIEGD